MIVVEGRRPHYWLCCQQGHLARTCSSKSKEVDKDLEPPKHLEDNPEKTESLKEATRKCHRVPLPTPKEKSQDGNKNEEKKAEVPVAVVEEQKEKQSPPKNSLRKKKRVEIKDELPITKHVDILPEKMDNASFTTNKRRHHRFGREPKTIKKGPTPHKNLPNLRHCSHLHPSPHLPAISLGLRIGRKRL